jgi:hypothetical protein
MLEELKSYGALASHNRLVIEGMDKLRGSGGDEFISSGLT